MANDAAATKRPPADLLKDIHGGAELKKTKTKPSDSALDQAKLQMSIKNGTDLKQTSTPADAALEHAKLQMSIQGGKELKKTKSKPQGGDVILKQMKLEKEIKNGVSLKEAPKPSADLSESAKAAFLAEKSK